MRSPTIAPEQETAFFIFIERLSLAYGFGRMRSGDSTWPVFPEDPEIFEIHLVVSVQICGKPALLLEPASPENSQIKVIHAPVLVEVTDRRVEQRDIVQKDVRRGGPHIEKQVGREIRRLGHRKDVAIMSPGRRKK